MLFRFFQRHIVPIGDKTHASIWKAAHWDSDVALLQTVLNKRQDSAWQMILDVLVVQVVTWVSNIHRRSTEKGRHYLADPAGMFHGQSSAGHRRSYVPFQIHHNGPHGVQAPWTVFLRHSKEGSHTSRSKPPQIHTFPNVILGKRKNKKSNHSGADSSSLIKGHFEKQKRLSMNLGITLPCSSYFMKKCSAVISIRYFPALIALCFWSDFVNRDVTQSYILNVQKRTLCYITKAPLPSENQESHSIRQWKSKRHCHFSTVSWSRKSAKSPGYWGWKQPEPNIFKCFKDPFVFPYQR